MPMNKSEWRHALKVCLNNLELNGHNLRIMDVCSRFRVYEALPDGTHGRNIGPVLKKSHLLPFLQGLEEMSAKVDWDVKQKRTAGRTINTVNLDDSVSNPSRVSKSRQEYTLPSGVLDG